MKKYVVERDFCKRLEKRLSSSIIGVNAGAGGGVNASAILGTMELFDMKT